MNQGMFVNRLVLLGLVVLLVIATTGVVLAQATQTVSTDVRITARLLENGKVEFGLQQRQEEEWGETILPRVNKFPYATADVDRWLYSSPVLLTGDAEVRITARLLENGKVEFGLQQREGDGWGETILPRVNKFPYATADVDRWLYSSLVTVVLPPPPAPPTETTGVWGYFSDSETDASGTRTWVGYKLVGVNKAAEWPYSKRVEMFVRCMDGDPAIFFWSHDPIYGEGRHDSVRATFRISGHDGMKDTWYAQGFNDRNYIFAQMSPFLEYIKEHYSWGVTFYLDLDSRTDEHRFQFIASGLHRVLYELPCFD